MRWNLTPARIATIAALVFSTIPASAKAGVVSGKVVMPEVCSPEVSPAVVVLEPKGNGPLGDANPSAMPVTDVALINQRGLQFVPRVQAITLGAKLRFTNDDSETHNVHILSPGNDFNESMAPGQPREFTPVTPGVVRLGCDVHSHMRGYVVVTRSPFVQVCSAKGNFRLRDVPAGDYELTIWHEMGDSLKQSVKVVSDTEDLSLGALKVEAKKAVALAPGQAEPVRRWPDVIDRIGMLLTASLDSASKPNGYKKARKLAYDSYFAEFETSDMETAIRNYLGVERAGEIERQFRSMFRVVREISEKKSTPNEAFDLTRGLMLSLVKASDDLNKKGVVDGAHLRAAAPVPPSAVSTKVDHGDIIVRLTALSGAFQRVVELADKSEADEAHSAMVSVYFEEFEPLEQFIAVRRPQDVTPLEAQFSAIRGAITDGIKGSELASRMAALTDAVKLSTDKSSQEVMGSFASAFGVSLITIVREGVEVILLLAMLFALVAKTGQAGAKKALYAGIAAATVASGVTAIALNRMVDSAQGRSRETLEGVVMLVAASVLFYVSYWLISQSESKRWMGFLKQQASAGANLGTKGFLTLMIAAFLAVYREGAETSLMYQAMISSQNGSREGLTGLAAGLGVGLVLLGLIAYIFKATTVKLPLRTFFQATGGFLFVLAVIFAGNGVFELQQSGLLKTTPLTWLGSGIPQLGVHPSTQALSVQGLLLLGALIAMVVLLTDKTEDPKPTSMNIKGQSAAGVGV